MAKIKFGYFGGAIVAYVGRESIAHILYNREVLYLKHSKIRYKEIDDWAKTGNYIFSNGGKLLSDVTEIRLCPLNEPSLMCYNPCMNETYLLSVENINGVEYVCSPHYIMTKKENPKDDLWSANYIPRTKEEYKPISQELLEQFRNGTTGWIIKH